jgi:hypothetical protein
MSNNDFKNNDNLTNVNIHNGDNNASYNEYNNYLTENKDVTLLPSLFDEAYEKYDIHNCIHSTIIKPSVFWTKIELISLCSQPIEHALNIEEIKTEKVKAFDLLDALSKSGAIHLQGTLHIVIAATHCFDNNIMESIIQNNMNPIELVEQSTMIMNHVLYHS